MQFLKHFISISAALIGIAILDRLGRSAIAHPSRNYQPNSDHRVSFNQQIVHSLGAANRAQQAYYFERAEFASNFHKLSESGFYLPESKNYRLDMESQNNSVFTYSIPLQSYGTYKQWSGSSWSDAQEPLYSYVSSITYAKENGIFQSILCVSKTIGEQKLAAPKIISGKLVCPVDTEEIN